MPASITSMEATVTDTNGTNMNPEVTVTVTLPGGQQVKHKLEGTAGLALTPSQITALQNAMVVLRTRATAITKQDFQIP